MGCVGYEEGGRGVKGSNRFLVDDERSTARENKVAAPTRVGDASDEAGLSTRAIQSQAPTLLQDSSHRTVEIDRIFFPRVLGSQSTK